MNKEIIRACVLPGSYKYIPALFRLSFLPIFNFALTMAGNTPWVHLASSLHMSLFNQINGQNNYSKTQTFFQLLTSVSVSFGLRIIFKESLFLQAIESVICLLIMRYKDITEGIKVYGRRDRDFVRKDQKLGRKSLLQTALTRFLIPYVFSGVNLFVSIFTYNFSKVFQGFGTLFSLIVTMALTTSIFKVKHHTNENYYYRSI